MQPFLIRISSFVGYHYCSLAPRGNNNNQPKIKGLRRCSQSCISLGELTGAMQFYPAAWLKLILPAVVIAVAYWGRDSADDLGREAQVLLAYLPYLLCVLAAAMAYQFNRGRLILAAVGVAGFYWLVQTHLQDSLAAPGVARIYLGLTLALPVLGFYLFVLKERGVLTPIGAASAAGFAVLFCLAYFLAPALADMNQGASQYYAAWPTPDYVMSQGASLLSALVFLIGCGALAMRHEESEAALLGAFVALWVVAAQLHLPSVSVFLCTAAALCILWGVLRSSHAMAYRDDLTGLPGRRALNERMKMLGRRYTIAMMDIDHFKRFNDTYGHDVGDDVLRLVASRLRRLGSGGTAYRYGGEEFCVVFVRRSLDECVEVMEALREEIASYKMSIRDQTMRPKRSREGARRRGATRLAKDEVRVTVSIGLAERGEGILEPESVLKTADKKLYQAKRGGRNRVAS